MSYDHELAPESSWARALIEVPSGALILIWQVIKSVVGRLDPAEAWETICSVVVARAGV